MFSRTAPALVALLLLAACSRAQHPAESPQPSLPSVLPATAPATTPAPAPEVAATNSPAPAPAIPAAPAGKPVEIASAPHPVETTTPQAPPVTAPPASAPTLRFLVPAGHGAAWLVDELGTTVGANVTVRTYATDAEFEAAFHSPDAPFDIVGITDRTAAALVAQHQLRDLPDNLAPPLAQPAPEFLHHYFDPLNRQTWPYGFTLYGFVAPAAGAAGPPRAWRGLAGEASLAFAGDAALRAALWEIALNKPPGAGDPLPPAWQKAALDTPAAGAAGARVDTIAHFRSLPDAGGEVILPAEGSAIVLYSWAIPADAPQPQLAEAALRALASPARAARIAAENHLAAVQPEARRVLPPAATADPLVYPPEHLLNQCRFVRAK